MHWISAGLIGHVDQLGKKMLQDIENSRLFWPSLQQLQVCLPLSTKHLLLYALSSRISSSTVVAAGKLAVDSPIEPNTLLSSFCCLSLKSTLLQRNCYSIVKHIQLFCWNIFHFSPPLKATAKVKQTCLFGQTKNKLCLFGRWSNLIFSWFEFLLYWQYFYVRLIRVLKNIFQKHLASDFVVLTIMQAEVSNQLWIAHAGIIMLQAGFVPTFCTDVFVASWVCSHTRSSGLSCFLILISFCYTEIYLQQHCCCSAALWSAYHYTCSPLCKATYHNGALLLWLCLACQQIWTLGCSGVAWKGSSCAKSKDCQSSACNLTLIRTNQHYNFNNTVYHNMMY